MPILAFTGKARKCIKTVEIAVPWESIYSGEYRKIFYNYMHLNIKHSIKNVTEYADGLIIKIKRDELEQFPNLCFKEFPQPKKDLKIKEIFDYAKNCNEI